MVERQFSHPVVALLFVSAWLGGCSTDERAIETVAVIATIEDQRRPASSTLTEVLSGALPEARARAALAMGRIQSSEYSGSLAAATRPSNDRGVRLAGLFALGQLGLAEGARIEDGTVAACRAALDDPDVEIVSTAVEALGKLATAEVPGLVAPRLKHPKAPVRAAAAYALFRYRFVPLWRREAEEPPPLPDASIDALLQAVSDPEAEVRRAVAYAFSRYGEAGAVEGLATLVGDEDEWARLFAVRGIGRAGAGSGLDAVLGALDDDSPRVRAEAVAAVDALGGTDRLPAAIKDDPSFHVRVAYVAALASSSGAASLARLDELEMRDVSPTVRGAALDAAASRRGDESFARLSERLTSDDWRLRAAAARAARHLPRRATEIVRQGMADRDVRVQTAALQALGSRAEGHDIVLEATRSDDLAVRDTAVGLLAESELPERLSRLTDVYDASPGLEWIEIREGLVDGVAELDGALPFLEKIARDDPASSVRSRARVALEKAGVGVGEASGPDVALEPIAPWTTTLREDPIVVLETNHGEVRIRCFAAEAPRHVSTFVENVQDGFYDGLSWHRVVSNFVIQGGDPRGDGWGSAGFTLRDEINRRPFVRGTVGMPKAGKDTGSCQVFITHVPTPHLDGNYTVFGQVVSGLEVVDRIEVGDTIRRARVE